MSYRIEYDGVVGKYEVRKNHSPARSATIALACAAALGILSFIPGTLETLQSWLIPGEDAVTVAAFQTMTDDLRSGSGLSDAFFEFCHTVIHGS